MKKAMNKEEVALLLDLIQSYPIITTKETNATSNKSKDEAWSSLVKHFNARSGNIPKTKEQLKLKWDNLKKSARKRSQLIRMNNLKTGGGKPDFIPPDEILEKVSGMLGATCTGFEVLFGGDGIGGGIVEGPGSVEASTSDVAYPNIIISEAVADLEVVAETPFRGIPENTENSQHLFGMPLSKPEQIRKVPKRKAISDVQMSTIKRNNAIANFYDKKWERMELEIKLLKLELARKEKDTE